MKLFDWLEMGGINIIALSVSGWLVSFLDVWGLLVASLVGVSVILVNIAKYKGIQLDNKLKEKELNE